MRDAQGAPEFTMPLAMAAVDVAGQIRERSPIDRAIFGEASGRLAERFVKPETGQALLARAVSDGAAEAVAWLATAGGQRRFRVSLWRQRGGERIRVLAAFSACETAPGTRETALPAPARDAVLRLGRDMAAPLDAVVGFAGLLRSDPAGLGPGDLVSHASDIVSAAWRLKRIADDLLAASGADGTPPPLRAAEVDIARLARRIVRLAVPAARTAGIAIRQDRLPAPGRGPLVLGDESTLWSAVEALLQNAVRHCGQGAAVSIALDFDARGLVLEVTDDGPGIDADRLARMLGTSAEWEAAEGCGLAICQALVRANGAELEIETSPGQGLTARIVFPAARCLNPV